MSQDCQKEKNDAHFNLKTYSNIVGVNWSKVNYFDGKTKFKNYLKVASIGLAVTTNCITNLF